MKEKNLIGKGVYTVKAVDQPLKKLIKRLKMKTVKLSVTTIVIHKNKKDIKYDI